jgi:hypothetical protein
MWCGLAEVLSSQRNIESANRESTKYKSAIHKKLQTANPQIVTFAEGLQI